MGILERRNREKEKRRNQIISIARKEFIRSGIRHTSIKQIAQKAEVSPRTIYTYFQNTPELYGAVLLNGLKVLSDGIAKIDSTETDPLKTLEKVKDLLVEFYNKEKEYFRIMMFIGFHDIHNEVSKDACEAISKSVLNFITTLCQIIEKVDKEYLPKAVTPWKLSWILWSLFVGIGHLNEARKSLNVGKNDFVPLFNLAFSSLLSSNCSKKGGEK